MRGQRPERVPRSLLKFRIALLLDKARERRQTGRQLCRHLARTSRFLALLLFQDWLSVLSCVTESGDAK